MPDDSLRRRLRFSLFLQGFAALMMGGAAVVRLVAIGLDAITVVLLLACAGILAAAAFTRSQLARLASPDADAGESPSE
ncbi:MAG: hypothetical protein ACYC2Z_04750 [Candidatus Nanopelagicales bacterium]